MPLETAVEQADLVGRMMGTEGRFLAYTSGVNEAAALQTAADNGTMGTIIDEAGGTESGQEEINIRQYQSASGRFGGRGIQGVGQRPGISGVVKGDNGRTRETPRGAQGEKPKQRIKISSPDGDLTFDAVHHNSLTPKQVKTVKESADYGYELHYYQKGAVFNDGERNMVVDRQAFMVEGLNAIFAMDGIDIDFLHHELFHQFLSEKQVGAVELINQTQQTMKKDSEAFLRYKKSIYASYKASVPFDLVIEEITCDLCEYAMSGSEFMYNRLKGLFQEGALEKLAEQARGIFEANKADAGQRQTENKDGGQRYYIDGQAARGLTEEEFRDALEAGGAFLDAESVNNLREMSRKYTTDTAKAFVAGYSGSLPVTTYQTGFDYLHTQGMQGVPLETAVEQADLVGRMMGTEGRFLAYTSGVNEAAVLQNTKNNGNDDNKKITSSQAKNETHKVEFNISKYKSVLKTKPSEAFFWSGRTDGIGGAKIAEEIAKSKNGVTLESIIIDNDIEIPEWDLQNPDSIKAWEEASYAYAEQVSGEIRAVIGKNLREGNIWENVELPNLISNKSVTKITIIDPKTRVETVIFER